MKGKQQTIDSIEYMFKQRKDELESQYQIFEDKKEQLLFLEEQTSQMQKGILRTSVVGDFMNEQANRSFLSMRTKCAMSLKHIRELIATLSQMLREIDDDFIKLTTYMNTMRYRDSLFIGNQTPHATIIMFRRNGAIDTDYQTLTPKPFPLSLDEYIDVQKGITFYCDKIEPSIENHLAPKFSFVAFHGCNYIVGDIANHKVKYISKHKEGYQTKDFPVDVEYPTGIAQLKDTSKFYVTDRQLHCVHIIDMKSGSVRAFGGYGNENGKFNEPTCVAVDDDNKVYVSDGMNNRIQIFSSEGVFISALSIPKQRTPFYPHCVLFADDQLVILDNWGSSVFSIDPKLKKISSIISRYGGGASFVNRPTYAAYDEVGRLFICDTGNRRIICFKQNVYLGAIEMEPLGVKGNPLGIAVKDNFLVFTTTAFEPYLYFISTKTFPNPPTDGAL
ncbi:nhl repeat-containing protein, putative [Entamoeba invadens IP1]|uniref:Nhl repeat-containing protein, putative n=1 Tax=Entamoeba invadens IP1 TaxID=370355 RepID=A0A0A1U8J8_ENTIV|nr:nhl repeat-containing protein, putative [Entamoeba invadens IP1]ELP89398.1 nhl repeat-containing protein, putative [Entamoeba invadens IP1]|eukprot:XP_004256169.1 nhl repeat-containing protein, putative [Entamoeba invadens IP1]